MNLTRTFADIRPTTLPQPIMSRIKRFGESSRSDVDYQYLRDLNSIFILKLFRGPRYHFSDAAHLMDRSGVDL